MPAIYNLAKSKLLPEQFAIVGVSIEQYSLDDFRKLMTEDIGLSSGENVDARVYETGLRSASHYVAGDFKDPGLYRRNWRTPCNEVELLELETEGNFTFFLPAATSPEFFSRWCAEQLGAASLTREDRREEQRRVVIEKPFGHDLPSAVALNRLRLRNRRWKKNRSTESTITSEKKPFKTSWPFDSPTEFSSRFGTAATWTDAGGCVPKSLAS